MSAADSQPRRARPITIAHRGASGYLPEHSLAAKALAHGLGADFLEQDIVATADDQLIVLHDIHLEQVTDVSARFPQRHREDGRFYARDFTLDEVRSLRLRERMAASGEPVYAQRYPGGVTTFGVPTLGEELAMIAGLNRSTGRRAGIYTEIKKPAWHRDEGVDIGPLLLAELAEHGYADAPEWVWLQCFDLNENIRLKNELKAEYRIVQLIGDDRWAESSTSYASLLQPDGLVALKGVADGIGPWIPQLYELADDGTVLATQLIERAHSLGMEVHPYTLRSDDLPIGFDSYQSLLTWLTRSGIDGVFTDFPDRAVSIFDQLGLAPARSALR